MKKSYNVEQTYNDMRIDRWIRNNLGNFPQAYSHLALIDTALSFNSAAKMHSKPL